MMDRVIEETASRGKAENDKAAIERELAELSSQLFQEANQMVALERMERLRAERKMADLESNLKDTESLMLGQGQQMRDMGSKIDEVEAERDELKKRVEDLEELLSQHAANESAVSVTSEDPQEMQEEQASAFRYALSPPTRSTAFPDQGAPASASESKSLSSSLPPTSFVPPTPGTPSTLQRQLGSYYQNAISSYAMSHPLQYLAYDILPFQEFMIFTRSMSRLRKNILTRPTYDPSAQGYGGYATAYGAAHLRAIEGGGPPTPGGTQRKNSTTGKLSAAQKEALREVLPLQQHTHFPFIKRIMEEDSDATLRLGEAPGIGLFAKGKIGTAVMEGTLIIEPAYVSLPSDKCSLCGYSLSKYISSHQTTQPKEDPKKKLTRLATGWMGGSNSGSSTPSKDQLSQSWSISTFTDALQALTPGREASGFNFGGSDSVSNTNNSNGRPKSSSGSVPMRSVSMSSTSGDGGEGSQGNFLVIPEARSHAQVYIFRVMDSTSRYALCPKYCLPRLRAVCELWTYVRTIERGLINEDHPKIYSTASPGNSSYQDHVRRLSSTGPPPSATSAKTPAFMTPSGPLSMTPTGTPGAGQSKELRMPPTDPERTPAVDAKNEDQEGVVQRDFANTANEQRNNVENLSDIKEEPASVGQEETPAASTTSDAKDAQQDEKDTSKGNGTEAQKEAQDGREGDTPIADRGPSTASTNADPNASSSLPSSEDAKPFNLVMPPARPKRSAARQSTPSSSPMTASTSTDTFKSPKAPSTSDFAASSETSTPATSGPGTPIIETTSAPTSVPPLPARTSADPNNLGVGAPPRLPNRPTLARVATNSSTLTPQPGTPGVVTAGPAPSGPTSQKPGTEGSVAVVNTKDENWQMQCWYEIIRLKEVTL